MQRMLRMVCACTIFFVSTVILADRALADGNCGPQASDFASNDWYPSNQIPYGMRAHIQLRDDTALCTTISSERDFVANWVALDNTQGTLITQIGWIHQKDKMMDADMTCRFSATEGGTVSNAYHCGLDPDGTSIYFKILHGYIGTQPAYMVYDCDTNGWSQSGCTIEDSSHVYGTAYGLVATESPYGQMGCVSRFNGSNTDKVNFGSSSIPINGEDSTGTWGVQSLALHGADCGHYESSGDNSQMTTYDDRNGS